MTSDNTKVAINKALTHLGLKKLCYAAEDEDSLYFTGCGDNGEPIFGEACCRISKKTMEASNCYRDDPAWRIPKHKIKIPEDMKSVFVKLPGYGDEDWEYA